MNKKVCFSEPCEADRSYWQLKMPDAKNLRKSKRAVQSKDSFVLMERKPATCFEEAYPIGNGFQGAMIYGDIENEKISLNDDTLWTGFPRGEFFSGGGAESLEKAKKLLLQGDYVGAEKEISARLGGYASQSYMPLGDLTVQMMRCDQKISRYKRTLDLSTAVTGVSCKRGSVAYSVTAFASNPDHTVVYRMESRDGDGEAVPDINVVVGLQSQLYSKTFVQNDLLCMEGECPVTSEQNVRWTDAKTHYFDEPEKRGTRFACTVDIITDGKKTDLMNTVSVENASYCEIRVCTSTSFNGFEKHPYTNGKDYRGCCNQLRENLLNKTYDELLSAHIKDHSRFFDRVKLDFGSDRKADLPTSERLRRYEAGESDLSLPVLLFNFGKYLTVAASREGTQPTNLSGIWMDKFNPPWHANYTVNINTEMNYFPTLPMGLTEMYEPMLRLIRELAQAGRTTAQKLYGADGWCCHHNTDIWRHTQPVPVPRHPECGFWNGAGGWLCHNLFEYYEYTLDQKFLSETAYPIMKEAIRFYLSQLITLDGYRLVFPSTSPENAFLHDGVKASVSETSEMTMAVVRELFANYLRVCEILNVCDDISEKVSEELPKLLPARISSDGRIMEWYQEHKECSVTHRHISHLYAFYPGRLLRPDNAPDLCRACRKSLEVRGDEGTGWSLAWKAGLYAALHDGNKAYEFIKKQLRLSEEKGYDNFHGGGVYTNLFGSCPPFQIDSNFGIPGAICEMLLQSDTDTLHIIPAIPTDWKNIKVCGLRAKGNRTISFTIQDGQLIACEIQGTLPSGVFAAGKEITKFFYPTNVT